MQVKVASENNKPTEKEEELKNGPINQRECRDIICCLLFIAACVICVYFFAFGLANGSPSRLFAVYDKSGAPCGLDDQSARKYLFFYTPASGYFTQTTCVETCPSGTSDTTSNCNTNAMTTGNCNKNNCSNAADLTSFGTTTVCYYQTTSFLGRVCVPTAEAFKSLSSGAQSALDSTLNSSTLASWINDIQTAKGIIGASVGIAFGLGLIYMIFLRIFAGLLVWIAIIAYFAALIALAVLCYNKSTEISDYLAANNNIENGSNTLDNQNSYKYIAIILFVFAGICFIVFLCLRNKIRQAIAIIKTTSQFVGDVWQAMLVPPIFTLIVAAWWVMWLYGYVYLYAVDESGKIKKSDSSIFSDVKHSTYVFRILWAYFFMGLWVNAFIQAICQFVLASAACIWYFSHGEEGQKHAPIRTSLYRAFRYHLGSLAFGALLLAIIQFIRVVLAYMEQQMKKAGADNNALTKFLLRCMACYVACFERFIKFLNRNAYIQIALKGQNFCVAAKDALSVIWSNAARFALVNGIGGAFIFLGKLFITCLTTFFCYLILTKQEPYKSELSSYILPCLIIFFIAYAISIVFMCVYGMGMQAILMCFLWDEKMFQNSVPPHAPALLQEFFQDNEKRE